MGVANPVTYWALCPTCDDWVLPDQIQSLPRSGGTVFGTHVVEEVRYSVVHVGADGRDHSFEMGPDGLDPRRP